MDEALRQRILRMSGDEKSDFLASNPNLNRDVWRMVNRDVERMINRIAQLELELLAADKLEKQQVEQTLNLTNRHYEAIRYLKHCADYLPVGLLKTKVNAFLESNI